MVHNIWVACKLKKKPASVVSFAKKSADGKVYTLCLPKRKSRFWNLWWAARQIPGRDGSHILAKLFC